MIAGSQLSGLSGVAALQKLRQREARQRLSPIPFIVLSGEMDLSVVLPTSQEPSPVALDELLAIVNHMLNYQQGRLFPCELGLGLRGF